MPTAICRFYFSAPRKSLSTALLRFTQKKIFRRKQHVERRTDFNCFLNGFSKKRKKGEKRIFFFFCADFHLSAFIFAASQIALAASSTSATDSGEKTNRFFWHQKATFLSWIFTSACIKWWHFYNQTRLAATITRKEQSHFKRDTSP